MKNKGGQQQGQAPTGQQGTRTSAQLAAAAVPPQPKANVEKADVDEWKKDRICRLFTMFSIWSIYLTIVSNN